MRQILACPDNDGSKATVMSVLSGEYAVNYNFAPKVILDIGAHIGAFTEWALWTYPGALIYAYEPTPDAADFFYKNHSGNSRVGLYQYAISDVDGELSLFLGHEGLHCNTLKSGNLNISSDHINVRVRPASILPQADLVKIDTEGAEPEILRSLLRVQQPEMIQFEFHCELDKHICNEMLLAYGYKLKKERIYRPDLGVMTYVRKA